MGLCRCPQRKVSTLYCFKHQVNVCESCLVNDHAQCVVRSFLSWLQDNDIGEDCALCQRSLTQTGEETIRLICYDLFHWTCLNEYFRSFPNHTAPAGYTCPTCRTCVFPAENLVSPVADHLRTKLTQADWANRFLILSYDGLPAIEQDQSSMLTETEKNGYVIVNTTPTNSDPVRIQTNIGLSYIPHRSIDMVEPIAVTSSLGTDFDEDKYKRRSLFTWLARWLRSRQSTNRKTLSSSTRQTTSSTNLTIYVLMIIFLVFLTLIIVLYHTTRGDSNEHLNLADDPQFNPLNNPFIRIASRSIDENPFEEENKQAK